MGQDDINRDITKEEREQKVMSQRHNDVESDWEDDDNKDKLPPLVFRQGITAEPSIISQDHLKRSPARSEVSFELGSQDSSADSVKPTLAETSFSGAPLIFASNGRTVVRKMKILSVAA